MYEAAKKSIVLVNSSVVAAVPRYYGRHIYVCVTCVVFAVVVIVGSRAA